MAWALDEPEQAIFRDCTGRATYTAQSFSEVTVIAGARAGKDSRIAAPIVVYEAVFGGHEQPRGARERAVIPLVAQDARAARIAFGYIREYLTRSPCSRPRGRRALASEITLTNGITIMCFPCTLKRPTRVVDSGQRHG